MSVTSQYQKNVSQRRDHNTSTKKWNSTSLTKKFRLTEIPSSAEWPKTYKWWSTMRCSPTSPSSSGSSTSWSSIDWSRLIQLIPPLRLCSAAGRTISTRIVYLLLTSMKSFLSCKRTNGRPNSLRSIRKPHTCTFYLNKSWSVTTQIKVVLTFRSVRSKEKVSLQWLLSCIRKKHTEQKHFLLRSALSTDIFPKLSTRESMHKVSSWYTYQPRPYWWLRNWTNQSRLRFQRWSNCLTSSTKRTRCAVKSLRTLSCQSFTRCSSISKFKLRWPSLAATWSCLRDTFRRRPKWTSSSTRLSSSWSWCSTKHGSWTTSPPISRQRQFSWPLIFSRQRLAWRSVLHESPLKV